MTVERLLQMHMAALAALGTLLLGTGQRNPVLPVLAIFAALTSVYFTDVLRWFWLNRTLGNVAALAAVLVSSFDFWNNASDQQLLAIANLLVYLQLILLYQQKNERRYWELAVLSLLQVVVAAALNLGFEFGLLLVVYMLIAFSALALFFVYREGLRVCAPEPEVPPLEPAKPASGATAAASATPAPPKKRSLRRRLLGDPIVVTQLVPQTSFTRGILGWSFVRHVGMLSVMTLGFTIVLFFTVPRTGNSAFHGQGEDSSRVGFNKEVTLNEKGNISQSDEIVMRVTFRRPGQDKPLVILGEPYFDGTVLTDYNKSSHRWSNPKAGRGERLREAPEGVDVVHQEVDLSPTSEPELFSVAPVYSVADTPSSLRYDWRSGQLKRRNGESGGSRTYEYTVGTAAFRENWQLPVVPHSLIQGANPSYTQAILELEKADLTNIDKSQFPVLVATADQIIADAELTRQERVSAAWQLRDHFRTAEAYQYTLDFTNVPRTPGVDPIEDFVANHKTGHCEYFASALCLMLRSQNIPARIVVGYKGGEHNSVGGYYWIRALHAHAWVEAYLEPDQIPENLLPEALRTEAGAWLRLDPTPSAPDDLSVGIGTGLLARVGDAMDYMQLLWDDYVLGLNSERQKKSIYNPLTDQATSAIQGVLGKESWREFFIKASASIGINLEGEADSWFSWQAGLAAIILCSALVLLYQVSIFLWRWLAPYWARSTENEAARARRVVEFYERLVALLASLGISRQKQQTQREFAASAALALQTLHPAQTGLSALPGQIVEAFYRVRFGETTLDSQQTAAIEHALDQLAELCQPVDGKPA